MATDWTWFQEHLLRDLLPRWLEASCAGRSLFIPRLNREWQPKHSQVCTLVSQSRLLYNLAVGCRLTNQAAYREALRRGAEALVEVMQDRDEGGWFWSCTPDGEVVEDRKDLYGHAFVIFALAHVTPIAPETVEGALRQAYAAVERFMDGQGGFVPQLTRDFAQRPDAARPVNSQNPIMHLFEALLAVGSLTEDPSAHKLAADIASVLFSRAGTDPADPWGLQLRRGLPELYTETWGPLAVEQGGRIDLGHQFEWAYLLSRAVETGFDPRFLDPARGLLEFGLRVGYDPAEGGIFSNASLGGEVTDRHKGWWQQCEAARTLAHWAVMHGREDLWGPFERTMAFCRANLIDPEFGGWYLDRSLDKGSEWKVDYHVVGLCEEAIRLAGLLEEDT